MRQCCIIAIILLILGMPSTAQAQLDAAAKAEIDKATKTIEVAPTAINYAERGRLYGRSKMYELAEDDYSRAIKLMPNEPGLYWRKALQLSRLKKFAMAIGDYNRSLKLAKSGDQDYIEALRGRAHCYDMLGGHQNEAKADLRVLQSLGDKAAAADLKAWSEHEKAIRQ